MEEWVTVLTFTFPQESYVVKSLLEAEGIDVFMKDEMTVGVHNFYSNAVGGVKLQVRSSQLDKALELLKAGGYNAG